MLTSLKFSVCPRDYVYENTLFPKSLNLMALTSLHLQHFTFCASGDSANDRGTVGEGEGGVHWGKRGGECVKEGEGAVMGRERKGRVFVE
ncbi:hypothetical protein AHAS_Ahas16G0077100 [Arachis hypogaea]|uniref:Uncharacterized protein n=1 Tax=Arachis hypogaea TaxID=3818 RepID=A0A444YJ73_ARAHY|nr:hypothetical protein Ahy_B06g080781 [Arachis hypogaea]